MAVSKISASFPTITASRRGGGPSISGSQRNAKSGEFEMVARVQNLGLARITAALAALTWWRQWGTGSGAAAAATAVTTTTTTEARSSATPAQGTSGAVANDRLVLTATIIAAGA